MDHYTAVFPFIFSLFFGHFLKGCKKKIRNDQSSNNSISHPLEAISFADIMAKMNQLAATAQALQVEQLHAEAALLPPLVNHPIPPPCHILSQPVVLAFATPVPLSQPVPYLGVVVPSTPPPLVVPQYPHLVWGHTKTYQQIYGDWMLLLQALAEEEAMKESMAKEIIESTRGLGEPS